MSRKEKPGKTGREKSLPDKVDGHKFERRNFIMMNTYFTYEYLKAYNDMINEIGEKELAFFGKIGKAIKKGWKYYLDCMYKMDSFRYAH